MFKRQANHKERTKASPTLKDLDFLEEHPGVSLHGKSFPKVDSFQTIKLHC